MGQDGSFDVGDNKINNIGLLRRFHQQLLKLKAASAHSHHSQHSCSGTSLKGPNEGRSLF